MITWAKKVAWVGMVVVDEEPENPGYCKIQIRLSIPGGRCAFGGGDTREEAIEDAAYGMSIDCGSVARKIMEHEWAQIAHT